MQWLTKLRGASEAASTNSIPFTAQGKPNRLYKTYQGDSYATYPHSLNRRACISTQESLDPSDGIANREFEGEHQKQRVENGGLEDVAIERPGHPQRRQHSDDKADRGDGFPQDRDQNACIAKANVMPQKVECLI